MRFIALVAIAIVAAAACCGRAEATPLAPAPPGAANAEAPLLERVANICGVGGCAPVLTKRVHKPPANFVKRAAPIVVQTNPQNAAPLH